MCIYHIGPFACDAKEKSNKKYICAAINPDSFLCSNKESKAFPAIKGNFSYF